MKILKSALLLLLTAVAGVLLLAAGRPSRYHVERSGTPGRRGRRSIRR